MPSRPDGFPSTDEGSKTLGIVSGEYARVESVDEKQNHVTVERENGQRLSYDPCRLQGVTLYREAERAFREGDRIQFTAPNRDQRVANRELGTLEKIDDSGNLRIHLDSGRLTAFNIRENPHLVYGYAVTSHSSQEQTAAPVLIHVDTDQGEEKLVNRRLAYVAVSRGRYDTPWETTVSIYLSEFAVTGERFTVNVLVAERLRPTAVAAKPSPLRSQLQTSTLLRKRSNQLS